MLNEENKARDYLWEELKEHVREVKDNFAVFAHRILMKVQNGHAVIKFLIIHFSNT